jgi:hypothetical protein
MAVHTRCPIAPAAACRYAPKAQPGAPMDLFTTTLLTVLLVVLVVLVHYETLLHASRLAERLTIPPRTRILVVLAAAFVAHIVEIGFFAVGYFVMVRLGLGALAGDVENNLLD